MQESWCWCFFLFSMLILCCVGGIPPPQAAISGSLSITSPSQNHNRKPPHAGTPNQYLELLYSPHTQSDVDRYSGTSGRHVNFETRLMWEQAYLQFIALQGCEYLCVLCASVRVFVYKYQSASMWWMGFSPQASLSSSHFIFFHPLLSSDVKSAQPYSSLVFNCPSCEFSSFPHSFFPTVCVFLSLFAAALPLKFAFHWSLTLQK